jgi:hypothetical protein
MLRRSICFLSLQGMRGALRTPPRQDAKKGVKKIPKVAACHGNPAK